ncbi:hypothetical protein F5X97DRAFT_312619 [Nemania serpens]|nr:hypothetical protein F5X97DRAFT_312619 [Nemania serpens]
MQAVLMAALTPTPRYAMLLEPTGLGFWKLLTDTRCRGSRRCWRLEAGGWRLERAPITPGSPFRPSHENDARVLMKIRHKPSPCSLHLREKPTAEISLSTSLSLGKKVGGGGGCGGAWKRGDTNHRLGLVIVCVVSFYYFLVFMSV